VPGRKTALITGATGGIGRAACRQLAAGGARLILLGRSALRLNELAGELGASDAERIVADLARADDLAGAARQILASHRELHLLLHCAGQYLRDDQAGEQDVRDALAVNCSGPLALTQLLLPSLQAGQADIVFVNSSIVARPAAQLTAYRDAKLALRAAADALRAECNPLGIRVLSVFPGRTATAMQAEVHRLEGRPYRPERLLQPEDLAALMLQATSMPRTAEVTEIHVRPMLPP
jgi:NADP-dependent 3-hydroxy acid dehydrogenase YdfG